MLQLAASVLKLIRWQGLSGGLQQLAFAAASEIVPKKHRGQTLAIMTLVSLPGSAFGAPIGELSKRVWQSV
jgi:predicted MFS family arabinose efflux permease